MPFKSPAAVTRDRIQDVVQSSRFQNAIIFVIIVNGIVLGLETSARAMEVAGPFLLMIDRICLSIFIGEIGLKFYALRGRFFKEGWNIFDFLVVAISLIPSHGGFAVLRSLRVLRVLRMISALPSMRRVIAAMLHALPGVSSVAGIVAIIFYVGAVITTKLFGAAFPEWFGSIGASFYTLFQIMTLESWSMGIVRPVLEVFPLAWMFFVPFIIVTTYTVINLVVGIIVGAMEEKAIEEGIREDPAKTWQRLEARLNGLDSKLDRLLKEKSEKS
ncbi:voltage-gated sodium channel [Desulfonatronum thiosulfatophilum]|uniref:Voltage-gated sodium channel n=1 Tax=Desulfonatronum thiosulfatophilum TaxID=617002 RepID=A0A1G6E298_9BACT|nr:ion transporter [Desulfonatronum thiosulfatophilum]SDB51523.1 voltage-gated sodium channel [Desulfonatronum thiosulfatophilum]